MAGRDRGGETGYRAAMVETSSPDSPATVATDALPLVLIPGHLCDARLFWHQLVRLSRERPVTVALPVSAASVEDIARGLLPGLPPRFAVAGHGLGASVALELLSRAPEGVARVALISLGAQSEMPPAAAAREERIVGARAGRLADVIAEDLQAVGLAPGPARPDVAALVTEMGLGLGADVYVAQARALQRRPDMQKVLRRANLPSLVL